MEIFIEKTNKFLKEILERTSNWRKLIKKKHKESQENTKKYLKEMNKAVQGLKMKKDAIKKIKTSHGLKTEMEPIQ